MQSAVRFQGNPILTASAEVFFESQAVFNISVVKDKKRNFYHALYRAQSDIFKHKGVSLQLSTIGYAKSEDRINFYGRRQFLKPVEEYETFGLEDPRITFFEDNYYIFYTALSAFPPGPDSVQVAMVKTPDFKTVTLRKKITFFNSKAMAMFPERINGKIACVLTVDCDLPPSKIALVFFEKEDDMYNPFFWKKWKENISSYAIPLLRSKNDHIEVGAVPLRVSGGWLLIYCYINNYTVVYRREFGIEAALLDLKDPRKIISRTRAPVMVPEYDYELYGNVPDVIFPSSALIYGNSVGIYYGAADSVCCLATIELKKLLSQMR